MQIKEVEERTGLSAKAIRYYESKGLLEVKRTTSDYREYDESCIEELQLIRLLRGLDISIADIKEYQMNNCGLDTLLQKQLTVLEEERFTKEIKIALCHDMLHELEQKDSLAIETYNASLQDVKDEDFKEVSKFYAMIGQHSLAFYIASTLILSGPILWLFLYIVDDYPIANPLLLTIFSCVDIVLITLLWVEYAKHRKEYRAIKKGNWKIFGMVILLLILTFFGMYCISSIQRNFLIPDDYLLWSMPRIYTFLSFIFMFEGFIIGGTKIYKYTENEDIAIWNMIWNKIRRFKKLFLLANLILLYVCISNINVISKDQIKIMRWYAPIYQTYTLEDIDHVETGFIKRTFSFTGQHTGDFYYEIHLKNGQTIDISQPTPRDEEKYVQHTYLEIEEYDAYLMKHNIKKVSSEDNSKYNDLAKEYKERFLKIVRNK
ncbi:MAG: MerR family transcriptional regulator [Longicatena sp.]